MRIGSLHKLAINAIAVILGKLVLGQNKMCFGEYQHMSNALSHSGLQSDDVFRTRHPIDL